MRKAQLSGRTALAVGFDTFSQGEEAKRLSRGARFGTVAEGGVEAPRIRVAAPSEEEAQKKERAERFGLEYSAPDPTGALCLPCGCTGIAHCSETCSLWLYLASHIWSSCAS